MRKIALVLCFILVGLAVASSPVSAHVKVRLDGNDVRSALDIRSAGVGHGTLRGKKIIYGFVHTYSAFRLPVIGANGDIYMDFDSRGGRKSDYYVWINPFAGELRAKVYKYKDNGSIFVGYGQAWRYDEKTVNFRFKKRFITPRGGFFRWYASTLRVRVNRYGNVRKTWDALPNRSMATHR